MKFNTIFLAGLLAFASNLGAMNQEPYHLPVPQLQPVNPLMIALKQELDEIESDQARLDVVSKVGAVRAAHGPQHGRVTPPNQGVRKGGCPKAPDRKKR